MTRRLFAMSRGTLLLAGQTDLQDHMEWLTRVLGSEAEAARVVIGEYRGHYSLGEIHIYLGTGYREVLKSYVTIQIVKTVAGAFGAGAKSLVYTGVAGDQWRPLCSWGTVKDLK